MPVDFIEDVQKPSGAIDFTPDEPSNELSEPTLERLRQSAQLDVSNKLYRQAQEESKLATPGLLNLPLTALSTPLFHPKTSPEDLAFRERHPIIGGIEKGIVSLAEGFTSPIGVATLGIGALPAQAQRAVAAGFAAQMASQVPEVAGQLGEEFGKPPAQRDTQKIAALITEGVGTLGMVAAAGKKGIAEPIAERTGAIPTFQVPRPLPTIQPAGETYASRVVSPEEIPQLEVRPQMGQETPLRQQGEVTGAREPEPRPSPEAEVLPQPEPQAVAKRPERGLPESATVSDLIADMTQSGREFLNSVKKTADEFSGLDASDLPPADRRNLARLGVSFSTDRENRIIGTWPAARRSAELRTRVSQTLKPEELLPPEEQAAVQAELARTQGEVTAAEKPITIEEALTLAEKQKASGESQLSVAQELSNRGLSDSDATGIAEQVYAPTPEPTPPPAPAAEMLVAREPWQMTKDEFRAEAKIKQDALAKGMGKKLSKIAKWDRNPTVRGIVDDQHAQSVRRAVAAGEPVPREVLADYPDLAKQAATETEAGETGQKYRVEQRTSGWTGKPLPDVKIPLNLTKETASQHPDFNSWSEVHSKPVATSLAIIDSREPIKTIEGRSGGGGLLPFSVQLENGKFLTRPKSIHQYAEDLVRRETTARTKTAAPISESAAKSLTELPPAENRIASTVPQIASEIKPTIEQGQSPLQVLSTAESVQINAPEGATYLQITQKGGGVAREPIAKLQKSNTFRGVDIAKVEAGHIGKGGKWTEDTGPLTVREPISVGPGAETAGEPMQPQLAQLTDSIKTLAQQSGTSQSIGQAFEIGKAASRVKDSVSEAVSGLKGAGQYLFEMLKNRPVWTEYKAILGDRHLALSESGANAKRFVKTSSKAIPDAKTQEAISDYIDAGGDDTTLRQAELETRPEYKAGYELARNLPPELITVAENAKNYFESRLQEAADAGILEEGVEDYIHRIFEKDSPWKQGVIAELRSGIFTGKPSLAKKRVFQYDYEAEKAGYKPIKSFIKRIAAYDLSLNKAIADRQAVKGMMELKESDGRPWIDVGGVGVPIEGTPEKAGATLIRPKYRPTDTKDPLNHRADYKPYDHPSLRKWKWVATDQNGNPVLVQGDVLIHPNAIPKIRALFERSAVRQNPIGRGALGVGSTIKQTMLDLSGFHPVQITVHGWEHRSFKPVKEIDFNNPDVRGLIRGGLVVGDQRNYELFAEGLSGSSLTKYIPVIGPKLQAYQQWLFNDYIPRLKVATGLHALERNRASFPKLSQDELYHQTAMQMNNAFGELNYEMLGRSKTTQDILRLALLAPDFLEARTRFAGEGVSGALGGYGREQFKALALGAATLYITARIVNKLLDDEYHFESKNAFSIVYKGRAYSLRTVQGDLLHALTDPGKFVYNRLNPVFGRTGMELLSKRDAFGRNRNYGEIFRDLAEQMVPISLRGLINPREQALWESFLNAFGVTERRSTSVDTIYTLADKYKKSNRISEPGEFIYDRERDPYRGIKLALAYDTPTAAAQEMALAIREGKTTLPKLIAYFQRYGSTPFTGSKSNDAKFFAGLTDDQKKIYKDALSERQRMKKNGAIALSIYRHYLASLGRESQTQAEPTQPSPMGE